MWTNQSQKTMKQTSNIKRLAGVDDAAQIDNIHSLSAVA